MISDLTKYFKKLSRKRKRGPVKIACTYKGPAVQPTVVCTYYIQRTIPLSIILGSQYKQQGPAVTECGKPTNDNQPLDVA